MTAALSGLAIGFAAGSLPFAWLLHATATGRDLRREGSGNPGATNLWRGSGAMWAIAAFTLDAGKAAAAVLVATKLAGAGASVPAALGSVVGHVFSPWLSGRGGKGVATAAGAYVVLAPAATGVAVAVFAVALVATRYVSLASVLAAVTLPLAVVLAGPGGSSVGAAAAIAALIAWRHRENFARMRRHTEPRVPFAATRGRGASE